MKSIDAFWYSGSYLRIAIITLFDNCCVIFIIQLLVLLADLSRESLRSCSYRSVQYPTSCQKSDAGVYQKTGLLGAANH